MLQLPVSEGVVSRPTLQSNLETGDYRIRQRGARAGAAGEGEAPGVSLHDHGGPYVAAWHGGGRGGAARRGTGGCRVRGAGGIGGGVSGGGAGAGGGGTDDPQSVHRRAGHGTHSGGYGEAHARGDGEQGADRARVWRAARRSGATGGGLAVRIQRDGWGAGVQPVAACDARGEGAGVHRGAEFDVEGGDRDDGTRRELRRGAGGGEGAGVPGGAKFDVEGGDRDDGTRRELRRGAGGGAADGDHGGRWGVRRGGLGLGGQDGGAGQHADGRADHAATGVDARDCAVDA